MSRGEGMTLTEYWQAVLDMLDGMAARESEFSSDELKKDVAYQNAKQGLREMAIAGIKLEENDTTFPTGLIRVGGVIKAAQKKYFKEGIPEISGEASRALANEYLRLLEDMAAKKVKAKRKGGWLQSGLEKNQMDGSKAGYDEAVKGVDKLKIWMKDYDAIHREEKKSVDEVKVDAVIEELPDAVVSPVQAAIQIDYQAGIMQRIDSMKSTLGRIIQEHKKINQEIKKFNAVTHLLHFDESIAVHWKAAKELPESTGSPSEDPVEMHKIAEQLLKSDESQALRSEIASLSDVEKLRKKISDTLSQIQSPVIEGMVPAYLVYREIESKLTEDSKKIWKERFNNVSRWEYVGSYFNTEEIDRRVLNSILEIELRPIIARLNDHLKMLSKFSTQSDLQEIQQFQERQQEEKIAREQSELKLHEKISSARASQMSDRGIGKAKEELKRIVEVLNIEPIKKSTLGYENDSARINFVVQLLAALNNLRVMAAVSSDINQRYYNAAVTVVNKQLEKFDPVKFQMLMKVLIDSAVITQEGCPKNILEDFSRTIKQAKQVGCIDDHFDQELNLLLRKAMAREKVVAPKVSIIASLTKGMSGLFAVSPKSGKADADGKPSVKGSEGPVEKKKRTKL